MVLDEDVAEAAMYGDADMIETWLRSLDSPDSPEDINEVDANGMTALNLCVKGVGNHFDDEARERTNHMATVTRLHDLGRAEGRWWIGGALQVSRVRVCATCRRSLDKLNFSRTQWNKKQVGVSRCMECVRASSDEIDMDAIAHTLATLNT